MRSSSAWNPSRRLWLATLGLVLAAAACERPEDRSAAAPSSQPRLRAVPPTAPALCAPPLQLDPRPGEYLRVAASQATLDVALVLVGPKGQELARADGLSPHPPPLADEELHWIATDSSAVRIEARLFLPGVQPHDPCALRIVARRPARAADRSRVAAEEGMARAHAFRQAGPGSFCAGVLPLYAEAARRFAALRLPLRQAEAHFGAGLAEDRCGHGAAAKLAAFTRALPLYAAGDLRSEAELQRKVGELRFESGKLAAALTSYRAALALFRRTGGLEGEAVVANDLGHALHLLGHLDEAESYFDRSLALWSAGGNLSGWANTLLNRGQLDRGLGRTEAARESFRTALEMARRAGDRSLEAKAQNALGLTALDQGRLLEALPPLHEALARREEGSRGQAVTLTSLGVAFTRLGREARERGAEVEAQGRFLAARDAYLSALAVFEREGDRREQVKCLGNLGWLEAETGGPAPARAAFEQARARLPADGDPPARAWVLSGLAEVERRAGDLQAARRTMEEALADVERQRLRQLEPTTREGFFSTQQDHYDFLLDLLLQLHRSEPGAGYDAEALTVRERAQARFLLDALAQAGPVDRGGPAAALARRERKIEAEIEALLAREAQLSLDTPGQQQVQALAAERSGLWRALSQVQGELRTSNYRYAALTPPEPWTAERIRRELLDRDTLLLEIRLGTEQGVLWALGAAGLTTVPLPPRSRLEPLVSSASELLGRAYRQKAETSAAMRLAELSDLLLRPVARLLPGKRLLVVADGALRTFPFSALPDPNGGGPLVAGHEVIALPSASVLGELRRSARPAPAPKALWVLAVPEPGPPWVPLPDVREEAGVLATLLPPAQRGGLLGREATREALLRAPLGHYRLLHFAAHGAAGATNEAGGLVLAQSEPEEGAPAERILRPADIYALDLRADLVTLSACGSGLGIELRGEGLIGLTRAFLYAGAERVLVSLWNVNGRASVALMERFYRGLLHRGLSPAAALREAQNAIRKEPGWRSPYYWAGFSLQGEWRGMRPEGAKPERPRRDLAREEGARMPPRRMQ